MVTGRWGGRGRGEKRRVARGWHRSFLNSSPLLSPPFSSTVLERILYSRWWTIEDRRIFSSETFNISNRKWTKDFSMLQPIIDRFFRSSSHHVGNSVGWKNAFLIRSVIITRTKLDSRGNIRKRAFSTAEKRDSLSLSLCLFAEASGYKRNDELLLLLRPD